MQSLISRFHRHLPQLSKFLVSGGLGAAIDFSLLNFFVWFFRVDARIGNIFSTLIAISCVFVLNKFFAFRGRQGSAGSQAKRFIMVYALAYILNVSFTAIYITIGEHFLPAVPHYVLANFSKAAAIGTVMFWNYFMLHSFVFGKRLESESGTTTL